MTHSELAIKLANELEAINNCQGNTSDVIEWLIIHINDETSSYKLDMHDDCNFKRILYKIKESIDDMKKILPSLEEIYKKYDEEFHKSEK